MGSFSVRFDGADAYRRRLEKGSDELKAFNKQLVKLAEPVQQEATALGGRFRGIGRFKVRRRGAGASVEQTAGKVTGQHGEFGALQMRVVLEPALASKRGEIERETKQWVEKVLS